MGRRRDRGAYWTPNRENDLIRLIRPTFDLLGALAHKARVLTQVELSLARRELRERSAFLQGVR